MARWPSSYYGGSSSVILKIIAGALETIYTISLMLRLAKIINPIDNKSRVTGCPCDGLPTNGVSSVTWRILCDSIGCLGLRPRSEA